MIKDGADYIGEVITAQPEFISEVGDNIFWDLAGAKTADPYVTYEVADDGYNSKSSRMTYTATVRIWTTTLTEAARLSGILRREVKENVKGIYDRGGKAGYSDPEAKAAYAEIIYQFSLTV